jgi:hypothetical protein
MSTTEPLSGKDRNSALEREARKYVRRGYRITNRTDTTVQLEKPKKFGGSGYMAKKDRAIYLEIDKLGRIKRT